LGADATGASSAFRFSNVVATEIFRWSTRIPKCAISALSIFRTVCFGVTSADVSTWISSTAPVSLAMILAAITPGNV
jgi:hypothetical protein